MDIEKADHYVLGDSERELRRLEAQAQLYSTATRDGLLAAGIRPGMRVLDLGTGAGDVALIAAELVGATGSVTGIDISDAAILSATARANRSGQRVTFLTSSMLGYDRYQEFDAVVSRFLLVHLPNPETVLHDIATRMRPGAILASMEMDMRTASATKPLPLFERHLAYIVDVYSALGLYPDMGTRLHETYRSAGLDPSLQAYTRVGDAKERAGFEFFSESIRSLLPAFQKLGIASAQDIDIDTLSSRLISEATMKDAAIFYPRFVVAWARR